MSNESSFLAIIIKKQLFQEADEIVTLYTKEQGKIRAIAKSVKSPKSKLQQKLQALFLVDIRLAGGKMPKVIGVETNKVYRHLRENLEAMKMAFYASEVVLKFTPDQQQNEMLFVLLCDFLEFLDREQSLEILNLGLGKFKILALEHSGFGAPERRDDLFVSLRVSGFDSLSKISNRSGLSDLQDFLSQSIQFYIERQIKSEKYLKQ